MKTAEGPFPMMRRANRKDLQRLKEILENAR
jgi:hypothetical protein